jgi:hypothetical protein
MELSGERRAFLLGMTLNELAFILFFLLLLISALTLKSKDAELHEKYSNIEKLAERLAAISSELTETKKKLELQEKVVNRLEEFVPNSSPESLDDIFKKLVLAEEQEKQLREARSELKKLARYEEFEKKLEKAGVEGSPEKKLEQLMEKLQDSKDQERTLQGRVQYLTNKLNQCVGTGLDHPPCWADKTTGSIEYLYRITIFEDSLNVKAIWPQHRAKDAGKIPGVISLAENRLSPDSFRLLAEPIFDWSKKQGCRHFVRIRDDANTSKQAYKNQLLTIESYFYKYLERD